MKISEQHIEHLVKLARLDISSEEKSKFSEQLASVVEYFEKLKELDLQSVEPLDHVTDLTNVMREDKPKQIWEEGKVLAEAPEIERKMFKVHKTL